MRKIILKLVLALFLLIIIALGIGWALIDTLAEKGIEKGATYALGVETTVDSVNLSLLKGSLKLEGLNIANPPNFSTPHLMNMGKLETELVASSLMGDTVEVTKFEIDGLDVNIEKDPGVNLDTNVSKIMQNLEKLSGEPSKEEAGGKKVKIDQILIKDVVVHFRLLTGPLGVLSEKLTKTKVTTVKIPEILLTNVSSDDTGVVMSELTAKVVTAILQAVLQEAEKQLPADMGTALKGLRAVVEAMSKSLGINESLQIKIKSEK